MIKNSLFVRLLWDYLTICKTSKEHPKALANSFIIGCITVWLIYMTGINPTALVTKINGYLTNVITALSILVGFSAASFSIMATSNSPLILELAKKPATSTHSQLEQLLTYFAWSVLVQLVLVLGCLLLSFVLTYIEPIRIYDQSFGLLVLKYGGYFIWTLFVTGTTSMVYSILITFRSVYLLYLFMISSVRNTN